MAGFVERIQVIVEAKAQGVAGAFSGIKQQVAEADGAVSKAKASFSGLGGIIGSVVSGPAGLAAAGAAVVGFAAKAVSSAEDLDLSVGKLRDATGLSADAASRWVDEGEKMGISADTLATSFGKLEKGIGATPDKFAALGVSVQHAKDGTVDMNATILNAIGVLHDIQDPAQKAAVAAQLFGKGWQSMSELIDAGSAQISGDLKSVSGAQLVSDDQIAQGRALRDSMHELGDAVHAVGITVGQDLVPGLAKAAAGLAKIVQSGPVKAALDVIGAGFEATGEVIGNTSDLIDHLTGGTTKAADTLDETATAAQNFKDMLGLLGDASKSAHGNVTDLLTGLNFGTSAEQVQRGTQAFTESGVAAGQFAHGLDLAAEAAAYAARTMPDATASTEDLKQATDDGKHAADLAKLSTDLYTAAIDRNGRIAKERNQIFDETTTAVLALSDDQTSLNQANTDFTKALHDGKSSVDERTAAAVAAAKAALQLAQDQATATGATLDAAGQNKVLVTALQGLEAQAKGPTAAAIQAVIDKLLGVPGTVNTTMQFNPDQQDLENEQARAQHWLDDNPATLPVVAKLVNLPRGAAGGGRTAIPQSLPPTGPTPAPVTSVHITVNAGVGTDAFAVQRAVTAASRRAGRMLDGTRMNGHRR